MKIILITGKFPQLSETFIIRKAIALGDAGHEVLIMARRRGDTSILKSFPNARFKVEYMPADAGPFTIMDLLRSAGRMVYYAITSPAGVLKLISLVFNGRLPGKKLKSFVRFLPFCNKKEFRIVHAEFLSLGPMYAPVKEVIPCRFLVSCRGSDMHLLPLKSEKSREAVHKLFSVVDGVHCVSAEMEKCVHEFSQPSPRTFVNRPAVDPALTQIAVTPAQNEFPVIVSTGRLEWIKGYDYLLKAYALLLERGVNFRATIIGGGSLYHELEFSIRDAGLEKIVKLAGPMKPDEVLRSVAAADIFVLSSVEEGISNAVLEAMALQIPVVSTRCGGLPEVIEDGVDGLLVPIRDPVALADALAELINSQAKRKTFAVNARRKISEGFSLPRQARVFDEAYKTLVTV